MERVLACVLLNAFDTILIRRDDSHIRVPLLSCLARLRSLAKRGDRASLFALDEVRRPFH